MAFPCNTKEKHFEFYNIYEIKAEQVVIGCGVTFDKLTFSADVGNAIEYLNNLGIDRDDSAVSNVKHAESTSVTLHLHQYSTTSSQCWVGGNKCA